MNMYTHGIKQVDTWFIKHFWIPLMFFYPVQTHKNNLIYVFCSSCLTKKGSPENMEESEICKKRPSSKPVFVMV